MELIYSQVFDAVNTLIYIKSLDVGFKIKYWCNKNIKSLASDYELFVGLRNDLYDEYCYKGEDEKYITVVDDKIKFNLKENKSADDFGKEMSELLLMECEIEPYILSQEACDLFPDEKGIDIDAIDFLLP